MYSKEIALSLGSPASGSVPLLSHSRALAGAGAPTGKFSATANGQFRLDQLEPRRPLQRHRRMAADGSGGSGRQDGDGLCSEKKSNQLTTSVPSWSNRPRIRETLLKSRTGCFNPGTEVRQAQISAGLRGLCVLN